MGKLFADHSTRKGLICRIHKELKKLKIKKPKYPDNWQMI
jgi:hypothetical protein